MRYFRKLISFRLKIHKFPVNKTIINPNKIAKKYAGKILFNLFLKKSITEYEDEKDLNIKYPLKTKKDLTAKLASNKKSIQLNCFKFVRIPT
jgi:hypothetical protein